MKVKTYKNARGKLSTDGFDPDEDGYDPIEEEQRELSEQEALDDYMNGYDEPDDELDEDYVEPDGGWYSLYDEDEYYADTQPYDSYYGPYGDP
jgi:hypothetical protein